MTDAAVAQGGGVNPVHQVAVAPTVHTVGVPLPGQGQLPVSVLTRGQGDLQYVQYPAFPRMPIVRGVPGYPQPHGFMYGARNGKYGSSTTTASAVCRAPGCNERAHYGPVGGQRLMVSYLNFFIIAYVIGCLDCGCTPAFLCS